MIRKISKKCYIMLAIVMVLIIVTLFGFRTDIKIATVDVQSDKLSASLKLALITDLHSCDYGENQKELLDKIYHQDPDVVLLGGDIVDDVLPQANAKEFLSAISEKYPTIYVTGNHEFWSGEVDEIKQMIKEYGVFVLEGSSITLDINEQEITIFGIDDPEVGETQFNQQFQNCVDNLQSNDFSVLLTHRPERIPTYSNYEFDLILAGHAHGGQWRIPGIVNGVFSPNQGLFPEYAGGLYEFENTSMVVSRGLARESTKVPRIFNQPEVVIINIYPAMNKTK